MHRALAAELDPGLRLRGPDLATRGRGHARRHRGHVRVPGRLRFPVSAALSGRVVERARANAAGRRSSIRCVLFRATLGRSCMASHARSEGSVPHAFRTFHSSTDQGGANRRVHCPQDRDGTGEYRGRRTGRSAAGASTLFRGCRGGGPDGSLSGSAVRALLEGVGRRTGARARRARLAAGGDAILKPQFLKGVRFTDLTWAGAGPFCTKIFSDFGADVLKIESTTRPDSVRMGGPFKDRIPGTNRSGYFASRNTGKKSVSLNLKEPSARELVHAMIRESDVVSNNFGPGAMDRLGLDYASLCKIKPDIIALSMPMYGSTGPRANLLGVGMTISAATGIMWHTAYACGDAVGPGTHYPDHAANPYHAAFAV